MHHPTDSKIVKELQKKYDLYQKYDDNEEQITWCGNCGNYGIQNALKRALTLEGIEPKDVLLCFDVGCNGNGSDKMNTYTFHGLHGRAISLGAGCALGNSDLKIIASAGDGATFSEGPGHLIHAVRNDYPMIFLHHNNSNYALTTGQASATSPKGEKYNSSPDGVYLEPINPLEVVLGLNPSFVARTFSSDIDHMTEILRQALNHDGFAFIELIQMCPTYNRGISPTFYWDKLKYTHDIENHDPTDLKKAHELATQVDQQIAVGLLYHNPQNQSFLKKIPNRKNIKTSPIQEVKHYDISDLLKEFE